MENVWDATKLMFIIYGLGAIVSFLVAWVIKLTFIAIRAHGARGEAGDAQAAPAKTGPQGGA